LADLKRIAIVGAGWMARVRARALQSTGQVEFCAIAARRQSSAEKLGAEFGCAACYDDFHRILDTRPDAILVEVPHEVQDSIVIWALEQHLHVLIGGSLATNRHTAQQIVQITEANHLVVEAGYEARYSPVWENARELVVSGALGRLVTVRSIALWAGDPRTWYYHQQASGGMPITHMTYCFINPVRWIVGEACSVSAYASRIANTAPELIVEENCVANMLFDHDVLCSMTAGFVAPSGLPAWSTTFIGTRGALEVRPDEGGSGTLIVYGGPTPEVREYRSGPNAFDLQASTFVRALHGENQCRNTPKCTIGDVCVAEAIVASVRERRTVPL
jgi:myo-inositol 2-dehydrogenase / D-chiro-inositol 1-dehydrogenase